jgi:predicted nucleotidyltransferase
MIQNVKNYIFDKFGYDILNIYQFGSRVYGTNTEKSDYDFIIVVNSAEISKIDGLEFFIDSNFINVTIYSKDHFQQKIDEHEISCLECLYIDEIYKFETIKFNFVLNLQTFRHSISSKCSNSWSVANKKLTVENDIKRSLKSIFHVFRIYDFAIQLIETNSINFKTKNHLHKELFEIPENLITWEYLKSLYINGRNCLATKFKTLANK